MNYQDAIARTVKLNEYATEFNPGKVRYIVVPSDYKEMKLFIEDYYKAVGSEKVPDCKEYCCDGIFSVYRIDLHSDNKIISS